MTRKHKPKGHINMISISGKSKRASDSDLAKATQAIGTQLAEHIAPVWGPTPALEFVPKGATATAGAMPCEVSDTPDQPGAAGYHGEKPDGTPFIKVFTFEGSSTLVGPDATSVTMSHEVGELTVDPPGNRWVDGPDGSDYAMELCDPVEGDTYELQGVSVSNFVYPAYFDPQAAPGSKFDYLGKLTEPFSMTPGGYLIKRTEPGNVSQVFAKHMPDGADCRHLGDGLVVIFGRDFPEWKKDAKIAKALRRRGGKKAA